MLLAMFTKFIWHYFQQPSGKHSSARFNRRESNNNTKRISKMVDVRVYSTEKEDEIKREYNSHIVLRDICCLLSLFDTIFNSQAGTKVRASKLCTRASLCSRSHFSGRANHTILWQKTLERSLQSARVFRYMRDLSGFIYLNWLNFIVYLALISYIFRYSSL